MVNETATVSLSRAQAAAYIQALGLPRNTLSALFDLPDGGAAVPPFESLGQQDQAALQVTLPLLASPALAVRTRAIFDEDRFLATWIVTGSGNDPTLTPYLLLAHDEAGDTFQIRPVLNRETVVRSFLPYLDSGLPAIENGAFELPVEAFVVLVALCDLYRRARFSGGLDHTPAPQQFTTRDLALALADGHQHPDPRWLLPYLLAIRPDLPAETKPDRWLQALARGGWLAGGDDVALSEEGLRLARALDQRLSLLSFWAVGATPQGEPASRSTLLVRSPWHIWCFDVGGDDGQTAIGAAVDVADAYGLLQDVLTPVGVPQPVRVPQPQAPAPAAPTAPRRQRREERTARPAPAPPPALQLVVQAGTQVGQSFSLDGQTTLGRSSKNMIRLDDQEASRQHARISPQGGQWVIEDVGSRNGTFIDGRRIGQAVALQAGDEIQIGDTLLRVSGPGKFEPAAAGPACPHCDQVVGAKARFCRHCGQSLP